MCATGRHVGISRTGRGAVSALASDRPAGEAPERKPRAKLDQLATSSRLPVRRLIVQAVALNHRCRIAGKTLLIADGCGGCSGRGPRMAWMLTFVRNELIDLPLNLCLNSL